MSNVNIYFHISSSNMLVKYKKKKNNNICVQYFPINREKFCKHNINSVHDKRQFIVKPIASTFHTKSNNTSTTIYIIFLPIH